MRKRFTWLIAQQSFYTQTHAENVADCYYNNNNGQGDLRFSLTHTRLSFYEQPVVSAASIPVILLTEMWRLYSLCDRAIST